MSSLNVRDYPFLQPCGPIRRIASLIIQRRHARPFSLRALGNFHSQIVASAMNGTFEQRAEGKADSRIRMHIPYRRIAGQRVAPALE